MVTPSGIRNWDPSGIDSLLEFENTGTLGRSATTADSYVRVNQWASQNTQHFVLCFM